MQSTTHLWHGIDKMSLLWFLILYCASCGCLNCVAIMCGSMLYAYTFSVLLHDVCEIDILIPLQLILVVIV